LPNLPATADEHRSLIALLIVSAFIVAGGIHYQTPMLAAIAADFGADAAATGWIPTLSFGGMLVGIVFFVQQKYFTPKPPTMTPEQEQQQKMMQWFMPIMFTAFMLFLPVGLTVYILTNTLLTIAQQQALYRRHPLPAVAPASLNPPTEVSSARPQRPARRRG